MIQNKGRPTTHSEELKVHFFGGKVDKKYYTRKAPVCIIPTVSCYFPDTLFWGGQIQGLLKQLSLHSFFFFIFVLRSIYAASRGIVSV